MPALGYPSVASHVDNNLPDRILVTGWFQTDAAGGIVRNSRAWFDSLSSTGARSNAVRMVIFADGGAGTTPATTVVGTSDQVVVDNTTAAAQWILFPWSVPPTLAPNTKYWVGLWWGTQTGGDARFQVVWDFSIDPADGWIASGVTYASTGNPGTPTWSDIGGTQGYSWLVNYGLAVAHDGYDAGNNPQTLTKLVTAGDLLVIGQRLAGTHAGATPPSDGINTWSKAIGVNQTTDGHCGILWYCFAATTATLSIVCVQNAGAGSNRGVFLDVSAGTAFAAALDQTVGVQGNNPTVADSGATGSLGQVDEVAVGFTTGDSGYTWGAASPWEKLEEANTTGRSALFYQETDATTALDLADTISPLNWTSMIATFKVPTRVGAAAPLLTPRNEIPARHFGPF
jgi:hypothetical protein